MSLEDIICAVCSDDIKSDGFIKCDGPCDLYFHLKCVRISSRDSNVLKNVEGVKWFCNSCLKFVQFVRNFNAEFTSFKEEMVKQLNEIRGKVEQPMRGEQNLNTPKSYAGVVAGESLIIKPKAKQSCSKTKETIVKKLKPADMEVGITHIRDIKDGGILLKCKSKQEIEKVRKEAERVMGKQYQVKIPQQKNPRLKIVDIEEEFTPDKLIEYMKKQNDILRSENLEINVIVFKKMLTRFMAIIECDPIIHGKILNEGRLSIGWATSCRVFNYVPVFRCYGCGGFNHKIDQCPKGEICLKCGSNEHLRSDCKSEIAICLNCSEANVKLNTNYDINHSTFNVTNCSVYRQRVVVEMQKIKKVQ